MKNEREGKADKRESNVKPGLPKIKYIRSHDSVAKSTNSQTHHVQTLLYRFSSSSKSNTGILIFFFLAGIRKKAKSLTEAGPWIVMLHLADNSIDGTGRGGEQLLELTRTLTG